jgi:hypothetical protein
MAGYAAWVGVAWYRYGDATAPAADEQDALLDRFMPAYDVVERHRIRIEAPAALTLAAARDLDLQASPIVHTIIRAREVILGATPATRQHPRGLLAEVQALGWGVLADVPDREVVVGAVTRPWEANVIFRAVPPDQFRDFNEPGYIKIAWTIRADETTSGGSIFRTETRAIATDAAARRTFRRYWAFFSPGIALIRRAVLGPLKIDAERRAASRPR